MDDLPGDSDASDATAVVDGLEVNFLNRRTFLRGVRAVCEECGVQCDVQLQRRRLVSSKVSVTLRGPADRVQRAADGVRGWAYAFNSVL